MTSQSTQPASEFAALREDLADLAGLVLAQVERAIAGWDASDETVAASVEATDREVDMRSAALEERILELHRNWAAFAGDLRLLHVGLITAVALERVGNLAVAISRLAGSVPPPDPELEEVRRIIREMGERAVDALAGAVQAVARGDVDAGERAVREARLAQPDARPGPRRRHPCAQRPQHAGLVGRRGAGGAAHRAGGEQRGRAGRDGCASW